MTDKQIYCVSCKKDVIATLTNGKDVYPHRNDLYNLKFYKCPTCNNFVGCHKGTNNPLGCIPSKELKQARIKAHNFIDSYWKTGKCKRSEVYNILSNHFGYEYHNGNTKSVEECEEAINVIKEYFEGINNG
jgi:hypothetical protein